MAKHLADLYSTLCRLDRELMHCEEVNFRISYIEMDFATYNQIVLRAWPNSKVTNRLHYYGYPCYIKDTPHPFAIVKGFKE